MKETIGGFLILLVITVLIGYFILRPLDAIGDIPDKIDELTKAVKELTEEIKKKGGE